MKLRLVSLLVMTFALTWCATGQLFAQGALIPPGSPAPTMKSLDEIYNKVSALGAVSDPGVPPELSGPQGSAPIHVTIKAQKQGDILGGSTAKGREGTIAVIAYSHQIVSPRDAASGLPTGKRQHKPITFTQQIDRATPQLLQAMVTNENLTSVVFSFYGTDAKGASVLYYKVTLANASIASISHRYPNFQDISLTYQKITWVVTGHPEASDDWETPTN